MICGWMAWSGLLVLVVKCVSKEVLIPGGGYILILLFILCFIIVAGLVYVGSIKTVE